MKVWPVRHPTLICKPQVTNNDNGIFGQQYDIDVCHESRCSQSLFQPSELVSIILVDDATNKSKGIASKFNSMCECIWYSIGSVMPVGTVESTPDRSFWRSLQASISPTILAAFLVERRDVFVISIHIHAAYPLYNNMIPQMQGMLEFEGGDSWPSV